MATAREIMTSDPQCIGENDTLVDAAKLLARIDVGAVPICGEDKRLKGMLTDRDIVVRALATGKDPSTTTAGSLATGSVVWVDAEADAEEAMRLMKDNQVRRLPVIADHLLVGIISQADIARSMSPEATGEVVEEISE
ncbi:CBS domain-containing protein [Microbacterium sp. P5_E9]